MLKIVLLGVSEWRNIIHMIDPASVIIPITWNKRLCCCCCLCYEDRKGVFVLYRSRIQIVKVRFFLLLHMFVWSKKELEVTSIRMMRILYSNSLLNFPFISFFSGRAHKVLATWQNIIFYSSLIITFQI